MKIEHILIPVDFSDYGQVALDYTRTLREKFSSQITLLHAMEPIIGYGSEISIIPADVDADREAAAGKRLQEMAATLGGAQSVCLRGKPWRVICEWAAGNKVDLIVMPTHGYSGLLNLWLGSVAERVVQKAPCAVLTVRVKES